MDKSNNSMQNIIDNCQRKISDIQQKQVYKFSGAPKYPLVSIGKVKMFSPN
jgi:hypothetical protein